MSARGPPRLVSTEYTNYVRTHIGHAELRRKWRSIDCSVHSRGICSWDWLRPRSRPLLPTGGGGFCQGGAPQPAPPADPSKCTQHSATACTTCKRLWRTAEACCALGHHVDDHIARRPQLQLCPLHGLPPCPRCTLKQRGVRHCCQRGHHKVCTPVPMRRKRPLTTQSQLPNKRPCLQGPARISTGLLRSPHQPPTPPAPKRRRPKTPPPSVPTSPSSTGAGGDRGRGCRTPAFRDEARESKHSGYLASKIQRF